MNWWLTDWFLDNLRNSIGIPIHHNTLQEAAPHQFIYINKEYHFLMKSRSRKTACLSTLVGHKDDVWKNVRDWLLNETILYGDKDDSIPVFFPRSSILLPNHFINTFPDISEPAIDKNSIYLLSWSWIFVISYECQPPSLHMMPLRPYDRPTRSNTISMRWVVV